MATPTKTTPTTTTKSTITAEAEVGYENDGEQR